jgi:hypothetical protein
MSLRYLFPCQNCDHVFELVSKQAGQDLKCPKCEATSSAPKLGSLRQLSVVGEEEPVPASAANAGAKNSLFVFGLALTILFGAAGIGLYQYADKMITEIDIDQKMEQVDDWLDGLPPSDVVAMFEAMQVDKGLGDWQEQPYVGDTRQGTILKNFSYGLMGLAGVGVLLVIGSFTLSGRRKTQRRR